MQNTKNRSSPYKFRTFQEICLLSAVVSDIDAEQGYTWIASPISAAKRKAFLEKALNQGENGVNIRADQAITVKSLSASIAKNEILRLVELRISEKGMVLNFDFSFTTCLDCSILTASEAMFDYPGAFLNYAPICTVIYDANVHVVELDELRSNIDNIIKKGKRILDKSAYEDLAKVSVERSMLLNAMSTKRQFVSDSEDESDDAGRKMTDDEEVYEDNGQQFVFIILFLLT